VHIDSNDDEQRGEQNSGGRRYARARTEMSITSLNYSGHRVRRRMRHGVIFLRAVDRTRKQMPRQEQVYL
jgi:hypothetical protein